MRNKFLVLALVLTMTASLVGCGNKAAEAPVEELSVEATVEESAETTEEVASEESAETEEPSSFVLEDGEYEVRFTTDSSMFHVNETLNDMAKLTVEDGKASVHITLAGTKIINLYVGLAADAEIDEANWLQPTEDEVTYDDGTTEIVLGFDVPVTVVDEEFDLALLGTKGTWYDHKVKVEIPQ